MAQLNEAYRVLSDPARRVLYDRSLTHGAPTGSAARGATVSSASYSTVQVPTALAPARVPWRLLAVMLGVGVAVVVAGAVMSEPAAPVVPDGILRPGDCVIVADNADVVETNCGGEEDLVVEEIVAFDEDCASGLAAYRDRQGLGRVCVRTQR